MPPSQYPPLPCPPPPRPAGAQSLLLDPLLGVLAAERGAIALIQAHPGLLALRNNHVQLPRQPGAMQAAAETLLARNGPARHGLAVHQGAQPPLTLVLERNASPPGGSLWLHLVDSTRAQLDAELLRQMFGLTPAEARVALLLAQGFGSDDIAARLEVQSNTVRGHIKQLLAKTHTHRQAQLVGWLWRSAAVVLTPPSGGSTPAPLTSGDERMEIACHYPDG